LLWSKNKKLCPPRSGLGRLFPQDKDGEEGEEEKEVDEQDESKREKYYS